MQMSWWGFQSVSIRRGPLIWQCVIIELFMKKSFIAVMLACYVKLSMFRFGGCCHLNTCREVTLGTCVFLFLQHNICMCDKFNEWIHFHCLYYYCYYCIQNESFTLQPFAVFPLCYSFCCHASPWSTLVLITNVLYPPMAICFFMTQKALNRQTSRPALCSLRLKSTSWQLKRFWSYWTFWLRSTLRRRKSCRWPLEKGSLCLLPGTKHLLNKIPMLSGLFQPHMFYIL